MCGRFTQRTSAKELAQIFGVDVPETRPRFNIAPTQEVLAVRQEEEDGREAVMLKWGLIPAWAKDPSTGAGLINARGETVAEKPSFREAFRRRRCLIPADGFYEWQRQGDRKQPFYFRMKDGKPFAFAGLWERWADRGGEETETCAILTTACNDLLRPVHERMPIILPPAAFDLWLDPKVRQPDSLTPLLRPYTSEEMESRPVSLLVNSPGNDGERCVASLTEGA